MAILLNLVKKITPPAHSTSVLCDLSQSVEHTVYTQCPQVTHPWGNHGYTNTYGNTLETKLIEIQKLSCNRETDEITAHDAIYAYNLWISLTVQCATRQ